MIKKSLHDRYADTDLRRVVEHPRDELEEEYAQGEALQQAKAIWERFGKNENHRKRVIMLLAQEALKAVPSRGQQAADQDLQNE
jgi:hypothetical protein